MLGKELIPNLLTVVIASVIVTNAGINVVCRAHTAAGGYVIEVNRILVECLVAVSCNDNLVVGMSENNLVCPFDHLVTDTEIKGEEEIIGLTYGHSHIRASDVTISNKAIELTHIGFICEIL